MLWCNLEGHYLGGMHAAFDVGGRPLTAAASGSMGGRCAEIASIVAIVAAFVVLVGGMVGYNAWATDRERPTPLVVDVTARQRTLVERYIKDIVLKLDGDQADPERERQRS